MQTYGTLQGWLHHPCWSRLQTRPILPPSAPSSPPRWPWHLHPGQRVPPESSIQNLTSCCPCPCNINAKGMLKYMFTWKPPSSLLLWSGCLHLCRLSSNVVEVPFPFTWSMFKIVMQYNNIPIQFTSNTWRSKTETPFYRYLRRIALYCCQNMPHLNQSNYSGSVYKEYPNSTVDVMDFFLEGQVTILNHL